ncbi:MAG: hypothetical protein MJB14_17355 [Spirochaetes bacterium]|nr:hypothetical protein [Spirochaetota bacterium]
MPPTMGYTKKIRQKNLEFNITWSPYILASKMTVLRKFTELTGIYVVFQLNQYKRLNPIMLGLAWYTGFRSTLLKLFDRNSNEQVPDSVMDQVADKNEKTYIKFLEITNLQDAQCMLYKLKELYPDAHFDPNGIKGLPSLKRIKVKDVNTKIYFKK